MRQLARHIKIGRWGRAALACLAILLLWPAGAFGQAEAFAQTNPFAQANGFAQTSGSAEIGRCFAVSDLAERGIDPFMGSSSRDADSGELEASSLETGQADATLKETPATVDSDAPCSDDPDADPSANFCFEDAEGQISTLPTLLAKWRGEQAAEALVDQLNETIDGDDAHDELLAETTVSPAPQPEDGDDASCSDRPDMCRSLPPLPPTLVIDASASAARQDHFQRSIPPTTLSTDDQRAWARLKVRPTPGYRTPPDQPPQA